ncbi:MAG: hypothetical protein JNL58_22235 [Planctomyces sp.]|nr:hypothetical protein [Planctomyces sp.]
MIKATFARLMLAAAVLTSSLTGYVGAQDKARSDQILPTTTYLYLSMPSVTRFKEAMSASSTGEMWRDPAFDAFKADVLQTYGMEVPGGPSEASMGTWIGVMMKALNRSNPDPKWDDPLAAIQETLGMSVDELLAIPTGEITMAVSSTPSNSFGGVVVIDFGQHESEVSSLLEKLLAVIKNQPNTEVVNSDYSGTEITTVTDSSTAAQRNPGISSFSWFLKEERLVVSNSKDLVELLIDNWDGTSEESLAANPVYSYVISKCESEPGKGISTAYADPIGMVTAVNQSNLLGEDGAGLAIGLGAMQSVGLNQFKAFGSVSEMGTGDLEAVSRSYLYVEQPPVSAMRMFMLDTVNTTPPSWVKDNVSLYGSMKWKIADAYDAIEGLVDTFRGPGEFAMMIDQIAQQPPMIHIKNDIVDQIDGSITIVTSPPDDESSQNEQLLLAIGVKDNQTFTDLLTRVMGDTGFPGETREFQGATLYEIGDPSGQTISFTVANNQLLLSVGSSLMEQVLRNDNDIRPLADTDEYRAAAERFREGALALTFTRPAGQYSRLYNMLRSGTAADSFQGMDDVFEGIDFTLLPPFEVVEKYLSTAGGSWVGDENGVLMESFSLKPSKTE